MSESRIDQFMASNLVAAIQKAHGASILQQASDIEEAVPRIPTGIFQVDYALGGGLPVGRVTIVYGHKSTGKSSLYTRALGNAQRMCANCWTGEQWDPETGELTANHVCDDFREPLIVYLDVEGTFDPVWAKKVGLDPEKLLISVPAYAEQALDMAEAFLRSREVDIIVIDSIAFMSPTKEIEESTGKALQAELPRTLGRGVRKFVSALNDTGNATGRRPTVLFTNQIRMKLGVMFGNPETQPGGFAPGYAAATEIKLFGGKYAMDDASGKPLHVDLKFRVEKNKTAPAHMEGEYRIILSDAETKKMGDVYDENFIFGMAKKFGLIERDGRGWSCLGEKYQKGADIEDRLMTDPMFRLRLGKTLLQVLAAA